MEEKNEAYQKQQTKILADNKKWFADNLESARKKLREDLGVMTEPMYHLWEQTQFMENSSEQDTKHSWKNADSRIWRRWLRAFIEIAPFLFGGITSRKFAQKAPP